MRLRQILMQRRIRKAKITRFTRAYMHITKLLLKMGFSVPKNPAAPGMHCMQGAHGLFLGSEKVGPGVVGFLYCCSNCRGWEEAAGYFKKNGKLPPVNKKGVETMVSCRVETELKNGVNKPVILYPEHTKSSNKPFFAVIAKDMTMVIRNFIIGRKKKKNGQQPPQHS